MNCQRFFAAAVLSLSVAMSSAVVAAEPCAEKCDAKCASSCEGGCPISKAMSALPKLTYQVGAEQTCCSQAAAKLSEEHSKPIAFVVGDKTFDKEATAMVALVDVTEKFVSEFATPHKCDVSGKTSVAGKELCCDAMAAETTKLVMTAMKGVAMTYKVGDKSCHCSVEAETLAKTSGAKTLFVVGEEETCCNVTARLKLAHAKYKAAVEALLASNETKEAAVKL